jgi:beta-barrel assembly-enhancing protease
MIATVSAPQVFDGRFSEARSAASRDVQVHFDRGAVVIERGDVGAALRWPLDQIETAEPITASSGDVLVQEPARAGGTLFVVGAEFASELARRAPHLTAGARRWQGLRPFVYVTAVIAAIAGLVYVTDFSPARSIARLLPHGTRVALGREVVRQSTGGRAVCEEPAGKSALAVLAKRLSDASGGKTAFKVTVADVDVINAFAAPGEQIVILRKLLETADSADEVAGVLAHEMGHGLELHPESGIVRAVGLIAITEFIFGGNGGTIGNIGLYLTQLGYSRQAEREADARAVGILKSAQISNRGIIDFFKRMSKMEGVVKDAAGKAAGSALDMLRTHPSTAERLAMFEAQPAYATTPALSDEEWRALKGICGHRGSTQEKFEKPVPRAPVPQRDI